MYIYKHHVIFKPLISFTNSKNENTIGDSRLAIICRFGDDEDRMMVKAFILRSFLDTYTITQYSHSLTHWGRVTHKCVSKLTTIGSDNGLSPGRRQAIIWSNDGILLFRTLGTNVSEILREIHSFSFKKMHLKVPSAKWRLLRLGLNELKKFWGGTNGRFVGSVNSTSMLSRWPKENSLHFSSFDQCPRLNINEVTAVQTFDIILNLITSLMMTSSPMFTSLVANPSIHQVWLYLSFGLKTVVILFMRE